MSGRKFTVMAMISFSLAGHLSAADFSDPNWPCVQRKVETISIGQMWPFALSENYVLDEDAQNLVDILSLRRVSLEEAEGYIAEFDATHDEAGAEVYGAIFAEILDGVNDQRAQIIQGIGRYAQGQKARASAIDEMRQILAEEGAKDEPDFDKLDALEESIDWDERIHKDRERALTYVCETPVILEKRLYALAQILTPYAQ